LQHVMEKKQANEQDRKVKGIYTMVRKDLNHVLRKWKEDEMQKFQEKQLFQVNWLIILTSVKMMKEILHKKIVRHSNLCNTIRNIELPRS
jgi:hypothetical protein